MTGEQFWHLQYEDSAGTLRRRSYWSYVDALIDARIMLDDRPWRITDKDGGPVLENAAAVRRWPVDRSD
jgi:hypothetical protein